MPQQLPSGFAALPYVVLQDDRLSPKAKLTYAILLMYAWQTQACWPLLKTLNRCLGTSKPTTLKALAELEEAGYIKIEHRPGQGSIYRLTTLAIEENGGAVKNVDQVVKNVDHMNRPNNRLKETSSETSSDDGGNGRTKGQILFLQKFQRKRFATPDQADAIRGLEVEVGYGTLQRALTWAAENNIRNVSSIRTAAHKMAEENPKVKKRLVPEQFRRRLYCPVCLQPLKTHDDDPVAGCICGPEAKRRWKESAGLDYPSVDAEGLIEVKAAGGAYEWLEGLKGNEPDED